MAEENFLDSNGFDVLDDAGDVIRIPMREANGGVLGISSVGSNHQIQVYSTKTHRQHILAGDNNNFSSEDAARSVIDAHNRSIKSAMFEKNETQMSAREEERYAERAREREAEANKRKTSHSHSIFSDY